MSTMFAGFDCAARFNIISAVLPVCSHNGKNQQLAYANHKRDGWKGDGYAERREAGRAAWQSVDVSPWMGTRWNLCK